MVLNNDDNDDDDYLVRTGKGNLFEVKGQRRVNNDTRLPKERRVVLPMTSSVLMLSNTVACHVKLQGHNITNISPQHTVERYAAVKSSR